MFRYQPNAKLPYLIANQKAANIGSSSLMNGYFTQLISRIGTSNDGADLSAFVNTDNESSGQVNYITIFKPDLVGSKEESQEELQKQILCFLRPTPSGNDTETEQEESGSRKVLQEHINIIGLIRGINSLAQTFSPSKADENSVIKGSKSTTIIKVLSPGIYLACSVSIPASIRRKADPIIFQLSKIIDESSSFFDLFYSSLLHFLEVNDDKYSRTKLSDYWQAFIDGYNGEMFKFPAELYWPNTLNYGGFLGLLGQSLDFRISKTYKKSSITLSYAARNEITSMSRNEMASALTPKGVIISYKNKISPKKYGLIFKSNLLAENQGDGEVIQEDSLIEIYNWLEYLDYHDKLTNENLKENDSPQQLFSSNETIRKFLASPISSTSPQVQASEGGMELMSRINPSGALELINPISLTNNLVILPLNYTMNSVMNLGGSVAGTEATTEESTGYNWPSVPSYLKPFSFGSSSTQTEETEEPTPADEDVSSESEDEYEQFGEYLLGSIENKATNISEISTRTVFLNVETTEDGQTTTLKQEYTVVLYSKDDILVTLLYDVDSEVTKELSFYDELRLDILEPVTEAISSYIQGGSILGTSIGSLPRYINGMITSKQASDNDFFFVIMNSEDKSIQSSLPYLPIISMSDDTDNPTNRLALKYQKAIFHLHDQLISLFITKKSKEFFNNETSVNEYLHKFNSNKLNDWMFYYIKYGHKYIIIIKNRHHNLRKKLAVTTNRRPASVVNENGTFISNITDSAYNYAHLGFLDSLGDDVKVWLEGFKASGET